MCRSFRTWVGFFGCLLVSLSTASAQAHSGSPAAIAADAPPVLRIDGPPPPIAPAVVNRDAKGRATVRATRLDRPLTIDGRLDEEIYRRIAPAGDFVQQLPRENEPATEATDM